MADGVEFRVNLPDFKRQMDDVKLQVQNNIVRAGARAAGLVFKERVIAIAPVSSLRRKRHISGTLRNNIILVRAKRQTPGTERWFVIPRSGRDKPRKGAPAATLFLPFYWKWVEEGHRKVPRGRAITGGSRTKALKRTRFDASGGEKTKASRFMQRAFTSAGQAALNAFNKRVQERIDKLNKQK